MKTAIYIENGMSQVVLTPENEFEKNAMKHLAAAENITAYRGSFYECQGGWSRHGTGDDSLILRTETQP